MNAFRAQFGGRLATDGGRCLIIGEVAQAHDGSLGMAYAFIDAIADAGADAVKFQTHIADAESSPLEPWRVKFSLQDKTRYDYWRRMEFTEEQWTGLRRHAQERGLLFLSSPFSLEAVELLERVGVAVWKIASGQVTDAPVIERLARSGKPILVSTGMSALVETDRLIARLQELSSSFAVMQCSSIYPCPPERVGLNMIPFFRARYSCPVGLSDHSGTIYAGLAATTLGLDVLEVHVTLSREMFGPDVASSVTTRELRQLIEGVRFIERMLAHPLDKDGAAEELGQMRRIFTKSLAARAHLPAGTVLQAEHLTGKKPGVGIPVGRLNEVIGRRTRREIRAGELLFEADIEA